MHIMFKMYTNKCNQLKVFQILSKFLPKFPKLEIVYEHVSIEYVTITMGK